MEEPGTSCILSRRRSSRVVKENSRFSPPRELLKSGRVAKKKKPRRTPRDTDDLPYDLTASGEPFACDFCDSPYVIDPSKRKNKITGKRMTPRQRFDPITGRYQLLCNACGLNSQRVLKPKKDKVAPEVIAANKAEYLNGARSFAETLRSSLGDPNAEKLYCPKFTSQPCRCVQTFLISGGRAENYRKRASQLLKMIKTAQNLSAMKCYDLSEVLSKGGSSRGKVGMGNGHKKSHEYEQFVLTSRIELRDKFNLCEVAVKQLLGYSNNFLFKRLKCRQDERRIEKVNGRGSRPKDYVPMSAISKEPCCLQRCSLMARTHSKLLEEWRERSGRGQKETRQVVMEMLTPSGLHTNCYNFIRMVTGVTASMIGTVRKQMLSSGGSRKLPPHGLKTYWANQQNRDVYDSEGEEARERRDTEQAVEHLTASDKTDSDLPNVVMDTDPTQSILGNSQGNPQSQELPLQGNPHLLVTADVGMTDSVILTDCDMSGVGGVGVSAIGDSSVTSLELVQVVNSDGSTQLLQVPIILYPPMDGHNQDSTLHMPADVTMATDLDPIPTMSNISKAPSVTVGLQGGSSDPALSHSIVHAPGKHDRSDGITLEKSTDNTSQYVIISSSGLGLPSSGLLEGSAELSLNPASILDGQLPPTLQYPSDFEIVPQVPSRVMQPVLEVELPSLELQIQEGRNTILKPEGVESLPPPPTTKVEDYQASSGTKLWKPIPPVVSDVDCVARQEQGDSEQSSNSHENTTSSSELLSRDETIQQLQSEHPTTSTSPTVVIPEPLNKASDVALPVIHPVTTLNHKAEEMTTEIPAKETISGMRRSEPPVGESTVTKKPRMEPSPSRRVHQRKSSQPLQCLPKPKDRDKLKSRDSQVGKPEDSRQLDVQAQPKKLAGKPIELSQQQFNFQLKSPVNTEKTQELQVAPRLDLTAVQLEQLSAAQSLQQLARAEPLRSRPTTAKTQKSEFRISLESLLPSKAQELSTNNRSPQATQARTLLPKSNAWTESTSVPSITRTTSKSLLKEQTTVPKGATDRERLISVKVPTQSQTSVSSERKTTALRGMETTGEQPPASNPSQIVFTMPVVSTKGLTNTVRKQQMVQSGTKIVQKPTASTKRTGTSTSNIPILPERNSFILPKLTSPLVPVSVGDSILVPIPSPGRQNLSPLLFPFITMTPSGSEPRVDTRIHAVKPSDKSKDSATIQPPTPVANTSSVLTVPIPKAPTKFTESRNTPGTKTTDVSNPLGSKSNSVILQHIPSKTKSGGGSFSLQHEPTKGSTLSFHTAVSGAPPHGYISLPGNSTVGNSKDIVKIVETSLSTIAQKKN